MDVSNDILDDESMIQPTISELENRIITLELRNPKLYPYQDCWSPINHGNWAAAENKPGQQMRLYHSA